MWDVIAVSGMLVLSDVLKGGYKPEKTPTSTGEGTSDSPENVAVFAALFDYCLNSNVELKGQKAFLANQDSEEKQSNSYPNQIDENQNAVGSMLEYGSLNQIMLQSNFPAAEAVNSGDSISQGTEKLSLTNEIFLPYGQVIINLLGALSGKTTDFTPEGTHIGLGGIGTGEGNQELTKIVQAWLQTTDNVHKIEHSISVQKALQGLFEGLTKGISSNAGNLESDRPAAGQSAALFMTKEGPGSANMPQAVKEALITMIEQIEGMKTDLEKMAVSSKEAVPKETVLSTNVEQQPKGLNPQESKFLQNVIDKSSNSGNLKSDRPAAGQSAALFPMTKEGLESANMPQAVKEALITMINQIEGMKTNLEKMAASSKEAVPKETVLFTNVEQQPKRLNPQESKFLQNVIDKLRSILTENLTKADYLHSDKFSENIVKEAHKFEMVKPIEIPGLQDGPNQLLGTGPGTAANVAHLNFVDGKIVWLPVWEQLSTLLREQVLSKQQTIQEFDIQLHPEELGKIRILLRWESGQVHLEVSASEAATGQLLQSQLPELRQNLLNQGVNCGSLQMGQNGEHQPQRQGEQTNSRSRHDCLLPKEDEAVIPVFNPFSYGQDGINRINVKA